MAFHLYSRGRATGVYLQNAPIFPTNLIPDIREGFDAIWNVSIITTTTATFEYSIDGGTTFFPLGTATASQELIANIKADNNDSFNLRITDVAGGTVFRIIVSIAPEDIIRALMPLEVKIKEPLKVDICPVTCEIDVDINSISFGTIPVSITGQPISVTETADPQNVAITGQPIQIDIFAQSFSPLLVDICPVTCDVPVINGSVTPLSVKLINPVGTPVGGTLVTLTNTVITANTDIFTAFSPTGTSVGDAVMFRIQWSAIDRGVLSYTLNNSNFVFLNDGNTLAKDSSHAFDILVDDPDSFTLRFDKNTTITFLRVVQLV